MYLFLSEEIDVVRSQLIESLISIISFSLHIFNHVK